MTPCLSIIGQANAPLLKATHQVAEQGRSYDVYDCLAAFDFEFYTKELFKCLLF